MLFRSQMAEKYELGHFGHCPRVNCHGAKVLPVGLSDIPGQETVKLFCPSCLDVYSPPNSRFQTVDGAFFGTTFGCLFFMTFPELDISIPKPGPAPDPTLAAAMTTNDISRTSSLGGTTAAVASSSSALVPPSPSAKDLTSKPPQPSSINGIAIANLAPGLGAGRIYEPRIYGFRVSERARSGPRMKWLREKPTDITETDEVARYEEEYGPVNDDGVVAASANTSQKRGPPRSARSIARNGRLRVNGDATSQRSGGSPMEVVGEGG